MTPQISPQKSQGCHMCPRRHPSKVNDEVEVVDGISANLKESRNQDGEPRHDMRVAEGENDLLQHSVPPGRHGWSPPGPLPDPFQKFLVQDGEQFSESIGRLDEIADPRNDQRGKCAGYESEQDLNINQLDNFLESRPVVDGLYPQTRNVVVGLFATALILRTIPQRLPRELLERKAEVALRQRAA